MKVGDKVICIKRKGKNPLKLNETYIIKSFRNINGVVLEGYESWTFTPSYFKSVSDIINDSIF